jgi:competence protein ComGC
MEKLGRIFIVFFWISFLILLLPNGLCGQTQREQEKKWARNAFKKQEELKLYPIFSGEIVVVDSNTFKFDEKTLIVLDNPEIELTVLLQRGIFYPNIVAGNNKAVVKEQSELDKLTEEQIVLYNLSRTDILKISDFKEVKSLIGTPKRKKFQFYLYRMGIMNPTICYIELANKSATRKTTLLEFVKNCQVTSFLKGSILL